MLLLLYSSLSLDLNFSFFCFIAFRLFSPLLHAYKVFIFLFCCAVYFQFMIRRLIHTYLDYINSSSFLFSTSFTVVDSFIFSFFSNLFIFCRCSFYLLVAPLPKKPLYFLCSYVRNLSRVALADYLYSGTSLRPTVSLPRAPQAFTRPSPASITTECRQTGNMQLTQPRDLKPRKGDK